MESGGVRVCLFPDSTFRMHYGASFANVTLCMIVNIRDLVV